MEPYGNGGWLPLSMTKVTNTTGVPMQVLSAPAQIPADCICAYTWHWKGDGRAVRNSPLKACPADHVAIDECAARDSL